jgi:hypothetical protein
MKIYAYVALALIVLGALGWGYASAYKSGKDAVVQKLQQDRVEILKDGKSIDENVLSSDDDGLICLLLDNCESDKPL